MELVYDLHLEMDPIYQDGIEVGVERGIEKGIEKGKTGLLLCMVQSSQVLLLLVQPIELRKA